MDGRCEIPRCRAETDVVYLDHRICNNCWNHFTANDTSPDALRMVLGIEAEPEPILEDTMSKTRKKPADAAEATVNQTESAAPETLKVAETKPKAAREIKIAKAPKPEKAAKKREPKMKDEGLVVFAFRLTEAERWRRSSKSAAQRS